MTQADTEFTLELVELAARRVLCYNDDPHTKHAFEQFANALAEIVAERRAQEEAEQAELDAMLDQCRLAKLGD